MTDFLENDYWYIHGARNWRIYRKKKSIIIPTKILIAHFLSPVFALASSPHASDHAIPSQTMASTPSIITILTNHLIISANILWKPASPEPTVHIYLRCCTGILLAHVFPSIAVAHWQTHEDHGTISVTVTVVAYVLITPIFVNNGILISKMESKIFFIFLKCEAREIR